MPHAQFKFSPVLVSSVISALRNLKPSKATGLDKTPAKILNCLWISLHPHSRSSLICLMTPGIYMDEWKCGPVTPIFKSGDWRQCENYCPISILPVVSKAFEKEVFHQLYSYLTENSMLSKKGLRFDFIREIFGLFVWETGRFCAASRRVAISVHWRKKTFSLSRLSSHPKKKPFWNILAREKNHNSVVTLENFYLTPGLWYAHFKMTSLFEKGQLVNRGVPSQWCASTVHCIVTISVD